MGVLRVIVQVVFSLVVVGAVMPLILFAVPAARTPGPGLMVAGTLLVLVFVLARMLWPTRRVTPTQRVP